jgi:hypothetical protein
MLERIQNGVERENPNGCCCCCCCSHNAKHGHVTGKDDLRTAKGERGWDGHDDTHTQKTSADPPAYRPVVDECDSAPNVDVSVASIPELEVSELSHLICFLLSDSRKH